MKVMQINSVYPFGSTGKIMHSIHKRLLRDGYTSIVCYGRGKKINETAVYKTCSELEAKINRLLMRFSGIMYGGNWISTINLINVIRKENPDIVHLHCINGQFVNIYSLLNYLKHKKIKTVITLHAEFMYTGNCGYAFDCEKWETGCGHCRYLKQQTTSWLLDNTHYSWNRFNNAYKNFTNLRIVSVSGWLDNRAGKSPMLQGIKRSVVLNGIDTDVFYDRKIKSKSKIKTVLFVTPEFNTNINHIKGSWYVVELAKRMIDENYQFIVVGSYERDVGYPKNIKFLGQISNPDLLADIYSQSDVTLLTSKRETFSMIVAESLCCGTPVIGFKAGAPETICIPEYCSFVEYGDIDGLYTALHSVDRNIVDYKQAIIKYSSESMYNGYLNIYKKML